MADRTSGRPQHHLGLLRFSKPGRIGPRRSKDRPCIGKDALEITFSRSVQRLIFFSAYTGRIERIGGWAGGQESELGRL